MPFHIFLAQWLSTYSGGLAAWKVGKDVLTAVLLLLSMVGLIVWRQKIPRAYWLLVVLTGAYFFLHLITFLFNRETSLSVATLATAYNNRLLWYLLLGFGAVLLAGKEFKANKIIKVLLIVSTAVSLLGIIQYFLPTDFMTHFGYSLDRGVMPIFYINNNPDFPRIMSTIRDPNSLGAYLVLPILLLVSRLSKRQGNKTMLLTGLLGLHLLALVLSFSRAAWGGTALAVMALFVMSHQRKARVFLKRFWLPALALIFIGITGLYSARNVPSVRSVVFRIDDTNDASKTDSDGLHLYFAKAGIKRAAKQPLGHGPGTAGIVSIQNKDGGFLTENYYIQIACEIGLIGLALFIGVWLFVIKQLYRRKPAFYSQIIAASVGYGVMALVMHLWTNEAVAAQWWLLAGMALGIAYSRTGSSRTKTSIIDG
jgi:O-antigen ligase